MRGISVTDIQRHSYNATTISTFVPDLSHIQERHIAMPENSILDRCIRKRLFQQKHPDIKVHTAASTFANEDVAKIYIEDSILFNAKQIVDFLKSEEVQNWLFHPLSSNPPVRQYSTAFTQASLYDDIPGGEIVGTSIAYTPNQNNMLCYQHLQSNVCRIHVIPTLDGSFEIPTAYPYIDKEFSEYIKPTSYDLLPDLLKTSIYQESSSEIQQHLRLECSLSLTPHHREPNTAAINKPKDTDDLLF